MTIYLASNNKHKQKEMAEILSPWEIKIPADDGIVFDPEENGSTFAENSLIKAKALWNIVKCPVIADDSGICVDILSKDNARTSYNGDVPGIYSARYAGRNFPQGNPNTEGNTKITSMQQNTLLIQHLNEVIDELEVVNDEKTRSCHYVCSMVAYFGLDKFYCIQETMEGYVIKNIEESCGTGGFGYDPIVFLPEFNKTVAELSSSEKNRISHRGKAGRILKEILFLSKK